MRAISGASPGIALLAIIITSIEPRGNLEYADFAAGTSRPAPTVPWHCWAGTGQHPAAERPETHRIGENGNGRRIELLMLETISASLKPGCARNFCHSGSEPKLRHSFSRAARSSKVSM